MDMAIPQNEHAKLVRRIVIAVVLLLGVAVAAYALIVSAPRSSVDGASLFSDTVKRGDSFAPFTASALLFLKISNGIPPSTPPASAIVLHPGATVKADSIILELTNPELHEIPRRRIQLKAAEAQFQSVKAQWAATSLTKKPRRGGAQ